MVFVFIQNLADDLFKRLNPFAKLKKTLIPIKIQLGLLLCNAAYINKSDTLESVKKLQIQIRQQMIKQSKHHAIS